MLDQDLAEQQSNKNKINYQKEANLDDVEIQFTNNQDLIDSSEQLITDIKDNQDEFSIGQAQIFDNNCSSLIIDEENNNTQNPILDTSNSLNASKDDSKMDLEDSDIEKKMEERLKKYGEQDLNYKLE